jgi:4-hydroxythreonine-4-phosphate dehydrogenase
MDHASELVVVGDPDLLRQRAATLGLPLTLTRWEPTLGPAPQRAGILLIHPISASSPVRPGHLDRGNAGYVIETLKVACDGCLS